MAIITDLGWLRLVIDEDFIHIMFEQHQKYVGRFAPSPTGQLHIGSLMSAVASYLDARFHHGRWLVRIEDVDPPRTIKGSAASILKTLENFGLFWDEAVVYQSQRHALYETALEQLQQQQMVYPCSCSRKHIWEQARLIGLDGPIHVGECIKDKKDVGQSKITAAWRVRTCNDVIAFEDAVIGHYQQNIQQEVGDFVLRRTDGFWAYQLAVVVDDAHQGINHVVRGQDLLTSTPRQIYLQRLLGYDTPHYAHIPLLINQKGQKWSKQTHAPALNMNNKEVLLRQVFQYLGLPVAPDVDSLADLLQWAVLHWCINQVPQQSIMVE